MDTIHGTLVPSSSNLDVELSPSQRFCSTFACLDNKEALKEIPQLAFKDAIFEACTKADDRNAYIVKLLRECLQPEWFKRWDQERNEYLGATVHRPLKKRQLQRKVEQAQNQVQ